MVLVACSGHPDKNEVLASHGRQQDWKAHITHAQFDGHLVKLEMGERVQVTIASCYAHAQQKIGDPNPKDHVVIQLDHHDATAGELDIADCSTKHLVASLWAEFSDGTKLEASIDADLTRRP